MCKAIDDMIEDGRKEGIRLAKKVYKLHAQGISVEEIARQCNISVEKALLILDDSAV